MGSVIRTHVCFYELSGESDQEGVDVMSRRVLRRRMRNLMIVLLMVAAFLSGFFGRTLLNSHAEEAFIRPVQRYYTSIQIQSGDSLWNIAERYLEGSGYSPREYVDEIKRMNGLKGEEIHAGEFLTVVYFAE